MHIYKITNLINGKIYIGKTIRTIKERFSGHKAQAKRNQDNCIIHSAMRKYGFENFKVEAIDEASDAQELKRKEYYWIRTLNSRDKNIGYNILYGNEQDDPIRDFDLKIKGSQRLKNNKKFKNQISKYLGVYFYKERAWGYSINFDGRKRNENRFLTEKDAAYARDLALLRLFKEESEILPIMNFPENLESYKNGSLVPHKLKPKIATKKSNFIGVTWNKASGKWIASICTSLLQKRSGLFLTEQEAAEKADLMNIELGRLDHLNFNISKYQDANYIPPKSHSEKYKYPKDISDYSTKHGLKFRVNVKKLNFDKYCDTLEEAIETLKSLGLPTTR